MTFFEVNNLCLRTVALAGSRLYSVGEERQSWKNQTVEVHSLIGKLQGRLNRNEVVRELNSDFVFAQEKNSGISPILERDSGAPILKCVQRVLITPNGSTGFFFEIFLNFFLKFFRHFF